MNQPIGHHQACLGENAVNNLFGVIVVQRVQRIAPTREVATQEAAAHAVIKTYEASEMLQSSGNLLPQSFPEVSIFEQPACLSKDRVRRWSRVYKDF